LFIVHRSLFICHWLSRASSMTNDK